MPQDPVKKKVAVIGGGVGGLAVAHELVCRDYDVTVFEPRSRAELGGKARSQYLEHPQYGTLPGEHGFRFLPGWYSHLPELMARIPVDAGQASRERSLQGGYAQSVASRLVTAEAIGFAYPGHPLASMAIGPIGGIAQAAKLVTQLFTTFLPVHWRDVAHLGRRFIGYMATCEARRDSTFDHRPLWKFLDGDKLQRQTQRVLCSLPRSLVAMDARRGNVRTFFNTLFMMFTDVLRQKAPRVLNGPTSEAWLAPWVEMLERLGVTFACGAEVTSIGFDANGRRVTSLEVASTGSPARTVSGFDHYVLAAPLHVAHALVTPEMRQACDGCRRLGELDPAAMTGAVSGVQLYLAEDVRMVHGHVFFPESEWELTAVSQQQFWERSLPEGVRGVLSACLTNFDSPDFFQGRPAKALTAAAIAEGVIAQLGDCLDTERRPLVRREDVVAWHVDDDLVMGKDGPVVASRHVIHPPQQLQWRPEARSQIENLAFAGDWVRNHVDLATMEGATVAARHAVNAVLARDGSRFPGCEVRQDERTQRESPFFGVLQAIDARLYARRRSPLWLDQPAIIDGGHKSVSELEDHFEGYIEELQQDMSKLDDPKGAP